MLVFKDCLDKVRLYLLLHALNMGRGMLIPERDDVIVPLRYNMFLELRYDAVVEFRLRAEGYRFGNVIGTLCVRLHTLNVRCNCWMGQGTVECRENIGFEYETAVLR